MNKCRLRRAKRMAQTKDTTIGIGVAPCNNRATRSLVSPRVRSRIREDEDSFGENM